MPEKNGDYHHNSLDNGDYFLYFSPEKIESAFFSLKKMESKIFFALKMEITIQICSRSLFTSTDVLTLTPFPHKLNKN